MVLSTLSTQKKNQILLALKHDLAEAAPEIFRANLLDLERSKSEGLQPALIKRLNFDQSKLVEVSAGLEALTRLPDPVGTVLQARELDRGLDLYRVACPIGLIAMIFESRPDALVQMTGLAIKSGNALILKGGREAMESNRTLARILHDSACRSGLPEGWLVLLESREETNEILGLHDLIDLIIPRGSNEFVQYIMKNSLIPVMGHADGICHAYISDSAEAKMAIELVFDSKTQYVAVCNAVETILVAEGRAKEILPPLAKKLAEKNVRIHGCPVTQSIIDCEPVENNDWKKEYLDYEVSIRVVKGLREAIEHINAYGSRHTELFIGSSETEARTFMEQVDAASVFWNASTRFADGFRYGLGAEVGISTGKLHARGPVGLEGLVTYKYKLFGHGQIVDDYAKGASRFTHTVLDTHKEPWQ